MEQELLIDIDHRFLTTKEIEMFDDTDLAMPLRKIPPGVLLPYHRKVIRRGQRMAQAIEPDRSYSYFKYPGAVRSCDHCVVGERGLDVLHVHPDRLADDEITVQKKAFKDSTRTIQKSEVIYDGGFTHLMLKDRHEDKETVLHVRIRGNIYYELRHLEPGTEFYILGDTSYRKGKSIIFPDGQQAVLFHKEGMYKILEDGLAKFSKVLAVIVGLIILFGGIATIAIETGYIVIVGIIMIPVTFILTAIVVAPVIWTLEFLRRFF